MYCKLDFLKLETLFWNGKTTKWLLKVNKLVGKLLEWIWSVNNHFSVNKWMSGESFLTSTWDRMFDYLIVSVLPEQYETTVCVVEISTLSVAMAIWAAINAIVPHITVLMQPAADVNHRDDCAAIEKGEVIILVSYIWFYGQKSTSIHLTNWKYTSIEWQYTCCTTCTQTNIFLLGTITWFFF